MPLVHYRWHRRWSVTPRCIPLLRQRSAVPRRRERGAGNALWASARDLRRAVVLLRVARACARAPSHPVTSPNMTNPNTSRTTTIAKQHASHCQQCQPSLFTRHVLCGHLWLWTKVSCHHVAYRGVLCALWHTVAGRARVACCGILGHVVALSGRPWDQSHVLCRKT